jgi:hypothetical protein
MSRQADEDVALAIELTSMCEIFHCLPGPGGLLDQDPKLLYMMREVIFAKGEKSKVDERGR